MAWFKLPKDDNELTDDELIARLRSGSTYPHSHGPLYEALGRILERLKALEEKLPQKLQK